MNEFVECSFLSCDDIFPYFISFYFIHDAGWLVFDWTKLYSTSHQFASSILYDLYFGSVPIFAHHAIHFYIYKHFEGVFKLVIGQYCSQADHSSYSIFGLRLSTFGQ